MLRALEEPRVRFVPPPLRRQQPADRGRAAGQARGRSGSRRAGRSRPAEAVRGVVRPVLRRLSRRLLYLRARPRLHGQPKEQQEKGRPALRRLPQHDGLFPRRPAAVRHGPRATRQRRGAGRALAGAGLRRRRPRCGSTRASSGSSGPTRATCATRSSTSPAPRTRTSTSARRRSSGWQRSIARRRSTSGGAGTPIQAIDDYFRNINAQIRWVEQARLAAEPSHLAEVLRFAERAYRRPLSAAEREDLLAFYRTQRSRTSGPRRSRAATCSSRVLMSPHFCFAWTWPNRAKPARPLTDDELASRLSYFLWSSMPDAGAAAQRAAAGELHQPDVLLAQARRMLRDDRVRGLAVEFGGNWLDFRRFEEHNSVDRGRFPQFTNELRQAMFEEPIRFLIDMRSARPLGARLSLWQAHVRQSRSSREHYGIAGVPGGADDWVRIDDAASYGRGGLLPMAVFLTQNAPGLRTSPVKRGYWVVRRLLGRAHSAAAAERAGAAGRRSEARRADAPRDAGPAPRPRELRRLPPAVRLDRPGLRGLWPDRRAARRRTCGGRPVETQAAFPGGGEGSGLAGLQAISARSSVSRSLSTTSAASCYPTPWAGALAFRRRLGR